MKETLSELKQLTKQLLNQYNLIRGFHISSVCVSNNLDAAHDRLNQDIRNYESKFYNIFNKIEEKSKQSELNNFTDGFIDNIINTANEEIMEEVKEDYGDSNYEAKKFKEILNKVKIKKIEWTKDGKKYKLEEEKNKDLFSGIEGW